MSSATPEQLFAYFDQLGIGHHTVEHPPFFTVEDGRDWHDKIPGLHCKNLFLHDGKDGFWLVVMPAEKRADLKNLRERLSLPRFSFGKADMLKEVLGVTPGSVTPFALINDKSRRVAVILDSDMMDSADVNFHPLHNAASTVMTTADLARFIDALGYAPSIIDCGGDSA